MNVLEQIAHLGSPQPTDGSKRKRADSTLEENAVGADADLAAQQQTNEMVIGPAIKRGAGNRDLKSPIYRYGYVFSKSIDGLVADYWRCTVCPEKDQHGIPAREYKLTNCSTQHPKEHLRKEHGIDMGGPASSSPNPNAFRRRTASTPHQLPTSSVNLPIAIPATQIQVPSSTMASITAAQLCSKVKECHEKLLELSSVFLEAAVLDPRMKWGVFERSYDAGWVIEAKKIVEAGWQNYQEHLPPSMQNGNVARVNRFKGRRMADSATPTTPQENDTPAETQEPVDEYHRWCGEPIDTTVGDPLDYWRGSTHTFPRLAKMAMAIYSIDGMSEQMDRMFRGTTDQVEDVIESSISIAYMQSQREAAL